MYLFGYTRKNTVRLNASIGLQLSDSMYSVFIINYNPNRYTAMTIHIHAYLRASTLEQDASRSTEQLTTFITEQGKVLTSMTTENVSGTTLQRPKLMELLGSMSAGDVLLIEQVDRLTRLLPEDWATLKALIDSKGISIVSMDLPTSYAALTNTNTDPFTTAMLKAINGMLLDMLAAIARKDYEDRRRRQAQGIANTKHVYAGRPADTELHKKIIKMVNGGHSQRNTAKLCGCSLSTVQRVLKDSKEVGDSRKQRQLIV